MKKRIGFAFGILLIILISNFVLAQDLGEEEMINGETRFTAPELFEDDSFEDHSEFFESFEEDVEQEEGELIEGRASFNWMLYGAGIVIIIAVVALVWIWRKNQIY